MSFSGIIPSGLLNCPAFSEVRVAYIASCSNELISLALHCPSVVCEVGTTGRIGPSLSLEVESVGPGDGSGEGSGEGPMEGSGEHGISNRGAHPSHYNNEHLILVRPPPTIPYFLPLVPLSYACHMSLLGSNKGG